MNSAEKTLARSALWATAGCSAAVPLLLAPAPEAPLLTFTIDLSLLAAFAIALSFHLAPLSDEPWFSGTELGGGARSMAGGAVLVVAVAGSTGLVALATSVALRYDASLQYLQLLSSLDIAGAAAALILGWRRWWGPRGVGVAAALLGAMCVWAVWRYLDVAGFTVSGGWVVDGRRLRSLILPYNLGATLVAGWVFVVGMRRPAP